jgi:hypothetical protein
MSKVSLLIVAALATVPTGVTTDKFNATLQDSEGVVHNGSVAASTLVANPDGSATLTTTLAFADDIPVGSFVGNVVTVDTNGAAINSPVSFTGSVAGAAPTPPAPNQQPVVTTVTVTVG